MQKKLSGYLSVWRTSLTRSQEERKVVPVTWSLWHGRPVLEQLDAPDKEHARRPQIVTFYRRFGLNLQMEEERKPVRTLR